MEIRDGFRNWWLVRQHGADRSYVLSAMVLTDYDDEGNQPVFESTVAGLEDRLLAHGETFFEAEENAMSILHDMLEAALKGEGLEACFGGAKGFSAKLVETPFEKVVELLTNFVESQSMSMQAKKADAFARAKSSRQWCAQPTGEVAEDCTVQ